MTIEKNIWADIQDGVTQGLAAAELVNDNKRAVNEVIDVVNGLGTASTMTNASGGDTLGTASTKNVATPAEALAGTAGVLPDAAGVHASIRGLAVGTVSQSGGVPTGAIIERGSNVNGEFVRFADGTQEVICTATIDFSNFTGQLSSGVWSMNLDIPAVFSGGGLTVGSVSMFQATYNSTVNRFLSRMQVNVSEVGVPTLYRVDNTDMTNVSQTREIRVLVRGRWY